MSEGEPVDSAESAPTPANRRHSLLTTSINLMSSTVITSGLGVLFWAFAARLYTTKEVGLANAALAAATLLAVFAQLSLGSICTRYLPRAGKFGGWILRRTYIVVSVCSLVLGLGFVVVWHRADYVGDLASAALFVIGVIALTLFAIQDPALLGFGYSRLVPIENSLFAVAKIALLPVFASVTAFSGIFAAWIIPAVIAVLVVGWYLFKRVVPEHARNAENVPLPPRKILWPMITSQYAATVTSQIGFLGVPLIVTAVLGAEQNGYLAIAWLVGTSFSALLTNISQSFSYHVRRGEAITPASLRRLGLLMALVGGVGSIVVLLAAPLILMIIAPGYQEEATPVLRLIALSVPFNAIFTLFATFLWLENRLWWVAGGFAVMAIGTLGLTFVLTQHLGLTGAGWALLISTAFVALTSIIPLIKRIRLVYAGEGARWIAWETNDLEAAAG